MGPPGTVVAAQSTAARPLARGPPRHYDHRALQQQSWQLLEKHQLPKLRPLVEDGTLVVLERPAGYQERRTDGYREPERLYLVGTSHVSLRSAEDVRQVVQAVGPDAVVVELCRSRSAVMYPPPQPAADGGQPRPEASGAAPAAGAALLSVGSLSEDEAELAGSSSSSSGAADGGPGGTAGSGSGGGVNPLSLSGGGLLPAFQRSVELGGMPALLLRLLLGRLSARLSGQLGVRGGGEFVAARLEGEARGAQLVLGDRPIEITLQRAWDALTWRRRAELASALAAGVAGMQQGPAGMDAAAIERMKEDDAVSQLFRLLSQEYPELVGPLIHERDLYLAWSLKRSKAVNGAHSVVGVVGKGHLRGVCYALTHDEAGFAGWLYMAAAGAELRFRDLVGGKNVKADRQRQRAAAVGRFAFETALFGALWYAWTQLQPQLQ